jgi:hypothetical protein
MSPREIAPGTERALELYGDFWFNGEPLPMLALRGNVVLLEFWDYTCCHSLRSLPYLEAWRKKYSEQGLSIIGVHTPKFTFGRDPLNVQHAIERLGIKYPVVTDNEQLLWGRYSCREWPTRFVVDKNGFLRAQWTGDGNYSGVEHLLQTMMFDARLLDDFSDPVEPFCEMDRPGAIAYRATPDLRPGYVGGSIGNVEGTAPESTIRYVDPLLYYEGRLYLDGDWRISRENISLEGPGSVILKYSGAEGTAVLAMPKGRHSEVTVVQDAAYLTNDTKGDDVRIGPDGRSTIDVDGPRMYQLVRNRGFGDHVLRLTGADAGLEVFSFGFISGAMQEMVSDGGHDDHK